MSAEEQIKVVVCFRQRMFIVQLNSLNYLVRGNNTKKVHSTMCTIPFLFILDSHENDINVCHFL